MTITDLFLLLLLIFAAFVAIGTMTLRVLGFSAARGAAITMTFICFGFWNPVGWIVLGLCVYLQASENRKKLEAARAAQMAAGAGQAFAHRGSIPSIGIPRQRRGTRC